MDVCLLEMPLIAELELLMWQFDTKLSTHCGANMSVAHFIHTMVFASVHRRGTIRQGHMSLIGDPTSLWQHISGRRGM